MASTALRMATGEESSAPKPWVRGAPVMKVQIFSRSGEIMYEMDVRHGTFTMGSDRSNIFTALDLPDACTLFGVSAESGSSWELYWDPRMMPAQIVPCNQ